MAENDSFHGDKWKWETKYLLNNNLPHNKTLVWRGQFFKLSFLVIVTVVTYSEKAMAPDSSTLAWKIPWTEEPGGLQSMGSLRVGHD